MNPQIFLRKNLATEVTPVGQIGVYMFEVGELTKRVASDYEKLVAPERARDAGCYGQAAR